MPYAIVAQQQAMKKETKEKKVEEVIPSTQRKSSRIGKIKHVPNPSPRKRVKETTSGPVKRRKTLQISSSKSEEETSRTSDYRR